VNHKKVWSSKKTNSKLGSKKSREWGGKGSEKNLENYERGGWNKGRGRKVTIQSGVCRL